MHFNLIHGGRGRAVKADVHFEWSLSRDGRTAELA